MAKLKLDKKDEKDLEIDKLKKQLMELSKKYLKKRKKEIKDKGKYKKVKASITKKTGLAKGQSEIMKLIEMLKKGVGTAKGAVQPIIQQIPATIGTIADRIEGAKKAKESTQKPLKLWRELKKNWEDLKDKYKNDTLTREDIVNIWNKAKKLAEAVQDSSLLVVAEITAMYGIGKTAYEYLMRFINKHKPPTENPVSTDDKPSPPPPDGGGGGGGGGGGDDKDDKPSPPPPPDTTPDDTTPIEGEQRGMGLGRFSDARARDVSDDPRTGSSGQTWTEYLKASMPTTLSAETAVATGLGALLTGGAIIEGQLAKKQAYEKGLEENPMVGRGVEWWVNRAQETRRAERRLRERGREQDARGVFGEAVRGAEGTDFVRPPEGLERVRSEGSVGFLDQVAVGVPVEVLERTGSDSSSGRGMPSQDTAYTQGSMPSQNPLQRTSSTEDFLAQTTSQQLDLLD